MQEMPVDGPLSPASNVREYLAGIAGAFGTPSASGGAEVPRGLGGSPGADDPDYIEGVEELVRMWLLEDLDAAAAAYQVDPRDIFEDVLFLVMSDAPELHRADADYAEGVRQLMGWLLDDIGSFARSFSLDPADVFDDFMRGIVSDTPLADRVLEPGASADADLAQPGR